MRKTTKGSTIIEMIIYMGLLSALLVVLSGIFTSTLALKLESESASAINQDARFLLSRISYDLSGADSVTLPANLGEESGSLQFTKSGAVFIYSVSDGNLYLTAAGSQSTLNGPDTRISGLTFRKIGNAGGKPTVLVNLNLESRITETTGNRSMELKTAVGVRN